MWILVSLVVVAVLAVGATIVFINAAGSAFSIFGEAGSKKSLFAWPENLWPRKKVLRFPLPAACISEADRGKPTPDLTLEEIEKAVNPYFARAEALYAAHNGPKSEKSEAFVAEARLLRTRAAEHRKRGKAGEQTSAWGSYAEACQYYAMVLSDLTHQSRK